MDGLRGIAIVLVVLSHGWTLWPTTFISEHAWVGPVFRSGDSAVTIFLVASGFLLIRAISASEDREHMQPLAVALRRVVRIGPAMWVMLVTVLLIASIDATDDATKQTNRDSFFHALTYTYNWMVQRNLTGTRSDLGHLWYISVDMQAVVLVSVLAFFLRHRPNVFLATLGALFVALVAWRFHTFGLENIYIVLNRTTVRMDPFLIGAIAAALVPRLPEARTVYRHGATVLLVVLVPTLFWCVSDAHYLQWGGTFLELVVAAFLLCVVRAPDSPPNRILGSRVLTTLGGMSLVIYVWHFPVFHFVRRHAEWDWGWKALVAFAATAVVAWLAQRVIERPVSRFLARPGWEHLRRGELHSLVASQRSKAHSPS